ncbi:putative repeat protein (TIGR03806 family) [Ulvibacter sp. MAR_2010_11]|uniref:hypothetical protein n=1 Tax=Ulvibacter sp. MAR_2010_11 TaxID=1250229 RepID=UPI000C2BB931|nr:hypothetical protein [Ulvibacter sp. MAR_2010_11]PKA83393.1 putative repeat protein (TIGR03806 family) [Ulvibacter sp. MAR_2010_11]
MKKFNLLIVLLMLVILNACKSDDGGNTIDTESPSSPLNLVVSTVTSDAVTLSWEASTDNTGVTGYRLFQDGIMILDNISGTNTTVSALCAEKAFAYYVIALDAAENESNPSNTVQTTTTAETPLTFKTLLSEMGVFRGDLKNLDPATDVQLYELNSALFTDYAAKQRLIRLPDCAMEFNNSDLLPSFPNNTLIAKTFYYNNNDQDPGQGKQIIETRILLKVSGNWQVGNYIWDAAQTEATLQETGSTIPISYIDNTGTTQNIDYMIPSKQDCFTCHNNSGNTFPIGMKLRSMNFVPSYTSQNQLDYFTEIGFLMGLENSSSVSVLPDWTNSTDFDIFQRGRAYIDINCAHCHQPGGAVTNFNLDFRLETPYSESGIYANRGEIEARTQSVLPTYRMPQLGRTIVHDEAVAMLLEYLEAID